MAVTVTSTISGPYIPNGATKTFAFDFKAGSADEIQVYRDVGDDWALVPSGDYSVSVDPDQEGGHVEFSVAPAGGTGEIYIVSEPLFTREGQYTGEGPFTPKGLNNQFDRAAVRDLALARDVGRSLKVPLGEASPSLPRVADRANRFLAFAADGSVIPSSGTGADAGLRTDLAEDTGPALVGFRQSGDADAAKVSLLLKLSEFVSVNDYLKGGDDTDAVQKAMERAAANGVECRAADREHVIGGTLYNPGCILRGEGKNTLFQKVGVGMLFTNEYTAPARAGYYLTDSPMFSRTLTLQNIAHAAMFTVGHWAMIASQAFYDTPNLDPNKRGEFVRIIDIIGATIVLDGPLMDNYPLANQPELIPVTLTTGVAYDNITCAMDLTVAPVAGGDSATELRQIITTRWALEPRWGRIWMKNSIGAGIAVQGTVMGSIDGLRLRNFGSADLADGTRADGGLGGYGYGVSQRGINFGLVINDIGSLSVRHTVTDASDYNLKIGRGVETTIANGTSWNAKLSGWDAHQLGYGLKMSNLSSVGSLGPGFTVRNDSAHLSNCRAINNLGPALALYKGPSENAENCLVDGFYADGNNWGQTTQEDSSVTDWRYKGTFLDMGTRNTIRNVVVDSCYGLLYETGPDSVDPTFENVRARNINKAGLANRAFWLRATGAVTHRIKNIDIDVTGAGIVNLVRNDSADFGNIPRVHKMEVTGTISGLLYSSALPNNQFVHWTGPGFGGYREAIALGGATTISLNGRIGDNFTITRTATEVLLTMTGRAIEGALVRLIAGAGGFYIQHGTGADAISLNGAPAGVSLTQNQSVLLQYRSGVWVEVDRSF